MLERQHGLVIFECDNCTEVLETDADEFQEALAVLRREKWKAEKVGTDWVHTCSACRGDGGATAGFRTRPAASGGIGTDG